MKRQIPVFRVHVQPGADYNQLHEIPEDISKFYSSNVSKKIKELYFDILNG